MVSGLVLDFRRPTSASIFANDTSLATIIGSGTTAKTGSVVAVSVYYNATDLLNSSSIMTDSIGAIAETMDYYPFGGIRIDNKTGAFNEQRKYIGQEYDQDTGLNYLNARYYNATLARFISQDPVFWEVGQTEDGKRVLAYPQLQNSYSYAGNNPVISKDPQGRFIDTLADIGFIAYDLYSLNNAFANGGNIKSELTALGSDVAGALIPGATGFGLGIRAVNKATDTARAVDKVENAGKALSKLPDNALVVRGGGLANQTAEIINKAINKSVSEGGQGFSVQCSGTCTNINQIGQLGQFLKNKELSVVKAGVLRDMGGDVIKTHGIGEHASVINIGGSKASQLPWEVVKNPNPLKK